MLISEVHACWPPKYGYGLLDLSVDHECRVCSWIGDDMNQIKLTEYQTMYQNANIGGTCMLTTKYVLMSA